MVRNLKKKFSTKNIFENIFFTYVLAQFYVLEHTLRHNPACFSLFLLKALSLIYYQS
jgi:hypothetical protein